MAIALIEGGADVNAAANDSSLEKPLHIAARKKDAVAMKALLAAKGIEADARDKGGRTPLYLAAAEDFTPGMLLLLQAGADPDAAS
jgi:ankyrin repeat protein